MPDTWRHQTEAIDFAVEKAGAGIFAGVGLGKTRIAIELLRAWGARRVLIVGPKAGLSVWTDQLKYWKSSLTPVITNSNYSMPRRLSEAAERIARLNGKPFALILNYEALWREPFKSWLVSQVWSVIICDEAHKLKSPGGTASKFIARLGRQAKKRLGLTGTPMAQSPLDAYALYRFLDPGVFGTSYAAFKSEYAVMDPVFPSRALSFRNMDRFKEKFDSIGFSINAEQAGIWLPEHVDIDRTCELTGETKEAYDDLSDRFCAEIRDGTVTPDNAAVRLLRLQQVTSGHVRDDIQRLIEFDSPKAQCLEQVLDELPAGEPVVVFCRFRPDLDLVHRIAERLGRGSAELSGTRNELAEWQRPLDAASGIHQESPSNTAVRTGLDDMGMPILRREEGVGRDRQAVSLVPSILAVQIQAGSAAVDLSRARYAIYYSVGYSLLDYEQSRGRIRRPNSEHQTVFYIHLVAKGTVDRRVYRALKARKQVIDDIMAGVKRGESLEMEDGI